MAPKHFASGLFYPFWRKTMSKFTIVTCAAAAFALASVPAMAAPPNGLPGQACNTNGNNAEVSTSTQVYQGFSSQPQHSPDGQGTSGVTTQTTDYRNPNCEDEEEITDIYGPSDHIPMSVLERLLLN